MNPGDIRTTEFRDICITEFDSAFERLQSSNVPLAQLPRVSALALRGDGFELLWRHNSLPSIQEWVVPAGHWLLHLPHPSSDALTAFQAHPEGCQHSLLGLPGDEPAWHMSAEQPCLVLATSTRILESLFQTEELDSLQQQTRTLRRSQLDGQKLLAVSGALLAHLQALCPSQTPVAPPADAGLTSLIRLAYSQLAVTQPGEPRISNRDRILTQALDFIRRHYARDICIADIVNHVHTTTRNLQIVFKAQFGMSPLQFLKRYRLSRFHQALRRHGSVTAAAVYSGLRHMGRVSDEYRKLFGRNPLESLNRFRSENADLAPQ